VDVGIILGVHALEFRVQSFVAGAGQAGVAFGNLEKWISFVEVGVVIISGQPGRCGVEDLVGLGSEQFVLNEATEMVLYIRSVLFLRVKVLHLHRVPSRNNDEKSCRSYIALVLVHLSTYSSCVANQRKSCSCLTGAPIRSR
jgi:hypothetical protein